MVTIIDGKEVVLTPLVVENMLISNDIWLQGAVLSIWRRSSEKEKMGDSAGNDGVGFNRIDRPILNKYAEKIERGEELTNQDIEKIRKRMLKYSSQLYNIAKSKNSIT